MNVVQHLCKLTCFTLLVLTGNLLYSQDKPFVYVWEFSSIGLEKVDQYTLDDFTDDFERSLGERISFNIVNRTNLDELLSQYQSEKRRIQEVSDIPDSALDQLKLKRAEYIIFGNLSSIPGSDEIEINVEIQDFNSRVVASDKVNIDEDDLDDFLIRQGRIQRLSKLIENAFLKRSTSDETQKDNRLGMYVWDFSGTEDQSLIDFYTFRFEQALVSQSSFNVLERINFSGFIDQYLSEKRIQSISDIPDQAINTLKLKSADCIVLGDIKSDKRYLKLTVRAFDWEGYLLGNQGILIEKRKADEIKYVQKKIETLCDFFINDINGKKRSFLDGSSGIGINHTGASAEVIFNTYLPGFGAQFTMYDRRALTFGRGSFGGGYAITFGLGRQFIESKDERLRIHYLLGAGFGSESFLHISPGLKFNYSYFTISGSLDVGFNGYISPIIGAGFYVPFKRFWF